MKLLLEGGLVYVDGCFRRMDVSITDGIIDALECEISGSEFDIVYNMAEKYVIPGLADVHVHLREPGFSYKETVATGTAAAARGGFTAVCAMPNVNPAPDTCEKLAKQIEYYARKSTIRVVPFACITQGGLGIGEPVDFASMSGSVAGFSDDGNGVQSRELMYRAMHEVHSAGSIIAAHCEDRELTGGGYIHDGAYAAAHGHPGIASDSEWRQVERDLELVRRTGCDYHVCHVSTKESVRLIRAAKTEGLPVTCETAPHYLVFCDEDLQDDGRFKMSPPIRTGADRTALIEAVIDGTVDMIATDHAPHSASEKQSGLRGSLNGVVGLETSLCVIYTHFVKSGLMSMERLVELMCTVPRSRFRLGDGTIKVGHPADLTVFDTESERIVNPGKFLSLGRATPFTGQRVFGDVLLTIAGGRTVWDSMRVTRWE